MSALTERVPQPLKSSLLAPQGRPFDDAYADKLAAADHLLLICGHYEGIDERVYARPTTSSRWGTTCSPPASWPPWWSSMLRRALPGVLGRQTAPWTSPSPAAFWNIPSTRVRLTFAA